jgi:hypothetical protein
MAAMHRSQAQRDFRCVSCFWGCNPLPNIGDQMGMNDGLGFVFNAGMMGISGDQRCKSFRNGDQGRGRGIPRDRRHPGMRWDDPRLALEGFSSIEFGDVAVLRGFHSVAPLQTAQHPRSWQGAWIYWASMGIPEEQRSRSFALAVRTRYRQEFWRARLRMAGRTACHKLIGVIWRSDHREIG